MDYNNYLLEEYKKLGKEPEYYNLGEFRLIIPASYENKYDFLDDLLNFQDKEPEKYDKYNTTNPDKEIVLREIKFNEDINYIVPLSMAKRHLSDKTILRKCLQKTLKLYQKAIEKTKELNDKNSDRETDKEPKEYVYTRVGKKHISNCNKKISIIIARNIVKKLYQGLKWSAKQTADVAVGLLGSPFFAAYTMLDKKYHIAEKKHGLLGKMNSKIRNRLYNSVQPKMRKALLTTAITSAVVLGGKYSENISQFADDVKTEIQLNKKYKITDEKSFDELYNASFEHIIKSLILSEVYVPEAYSDNGSTVNTVGLGSYYYPCDGNPKSSEWQTVSSYAKKHGNIEVDGNEAVKLVKGWGDSRECGRIKKSILAALMGAELNVGQFSAIFTCYYNSEVSGKKVAKFVSENYNDQYACALMFMSVSPNNEFNDGINKRHLHEALEYLNHGGYNKKIDKLLVEKRTAKDGSTFYATSITQLTPKDCQKFKQALKENNKEVISQICEKIFEYEGKGNGKTIKSIYKDNNMDNAVSEVTMQNVSKSRTISWDNALSIASNSGKLH